MSKKVVVIIPYFMSIVNNVIPCVTSYYVKKGSGNYSLFYVYCQQCDPLCHQLLCQKR